MTQDSAVTASPSEATVAPSEFNALSAVIGALQPFDDEARRRIVDATVTFLRIGRSGRTADTVPFDPPRSGTGAQHAPFSENTQMSPKEFLLEKQPRTDVERVACLAYYLTHYRGSPHFRTLDLSVLNTEAAQPKFANTANSANNAVKLGYLVPSTKGQRQLSAVGERFVRALPDRDAAKAALESVRRRSRPKRQRPRGVNDETEG